MFTWKTLIAALAIIVSAAQAAQAAHAAQAAADPNSQLKIIFVTPEMKDVMKTGGLADAGTSLGEALATGAKVEFIMPYYTGADAEIPQPGRKPKILKGLNANVARSTGEKIRVGVDYVNGQARRQVEFSTHAATLHGLATTFLRHESAPGEVNFFDNTFENRNNGSKQSHYTPEFRAGESWGAFAKAAAEKILAQKPDLVVLNDWTGGLIALHLAEAKAKGQKVPKVIFAIHNLAYQGNFPVQLADYLGLDRRYMNHGESGYEFWGKMSMLKAGLALSDVAYTVSERYAQEISTERFGSGMHGLIRHLVSEGRMMGVLNGINAEEWNPSKKTAELRFAFTEKNFLNKTNGKKEIQREFGLPVTKDVPMFVLTSRVAEQKGFEYMIKAIEQSAATMDAQFVIVGDGDPAYIEKMQELQKKYPERVRYTGFSDRLEKQLTRYGDFFVNGAWFEPSGLNQMYALANGTLPVVSKVGGLADSVKHMVNGVLFNIVERNVENQHRYQTEETARNMTQALAQAVEIFKNKKSLRAMRRAAMSENNSWDSRVQAEFKYMFRYVLEDGAKRLQKLDPQFRSEARKPSRTAAQAGLMQIPQARMCSALFSLR